MKMAAFWDVTPCGLVEVNRRFRYVHCLHHQGVMYRVKKKRKAVPLHAMEALGGRGDIAPTHSRPRH
jgi:hypothetical protein